MTTTGTYTFAIAGIHCSSCTILIDETIEALPGVTQATTHLRRGKCVVELTWPASNPRRSPRRSTSSATRSP